MAVKPIYEDRLNQLGCGEGGGNIDLKSILQKLTELENQVSTQQQTIQTLEEKLATKLEQSDLVVVYSLEDKPLFQAILLTGEQNGGSEN